jgi:hypothetical protein
MIFGEPGLSIYATSAAWQRRRVEKPNSSSQLTERDKETAHTRMVIAARSRAGNVSRGETREPVTSPILGPSCGFMAQIIGQVLAPEHAYSGFAARAYGINHAPQPQLVDSI